MGSQGLSLENHPVSSLKGTLQKLWYVWSQQFPQSQLGIFP